MGSSSPGGASRQQEQVREAGLVLGDFQKVLGFLGCREGGATLPLLLHTWGSRLALTTRPPSGPMGRC